MLFDPYHAPTPIQCHDLVGDPDGMGHGAVHTQRKITTMSPLPLTVFPNESEEIVEVSQADAILLKRLGMEALPAHETLLLPVERLIVAGAEHLARSAKRLVKSIQRVGLLQSPSVVVQGHADIHDPDAT